MTAVSIEPSIRHYRGSISIEWVRLFTWRKTIYLEVSGGHGAGTNFCQNPTQPKSNWQLQPTLTDWLTIGFDFVFLWNNNSKKNQSCKKAVSWYLGYRTFFAENPDIFIENIVSDIELPYLTGHIVIAFMQVYQIIRTQKLNVRTMVPHYEKKQSQRVK